MKPTQNWRSVTHRPPQPGERCRGRLSGFARLSVPILLILLTSLACSIPAMRQATGTPGSLAATATPAPLAGTPAVVPQAQAAVDVQFPPALVEVDPLPGSVLSAGSAPIFYFNQPMNRASVEGALQVEPALPARFEWLDDATLRLVPDHAPEAGQDVQVTLSTAARAANGQPLAEAVLVSYQSPGFLRLAERLPAPGGLDVNPSSAIVATFNRPVVPLGTDPASPPPAFSLEPLAAGRGEWLNTSTYIFYPEPALLGGARYTVRLNTGLAAGDGSPLAAEDAGQDWTFTTAAPALISIQPTTEQPIALDDAFVLTFNQPMDPASVESAFVLARGETPVEGSFSWNETATEMTFRPAVLLDRSASYGLGLFGAARSQGGAALAQDFAASLITVAQFGIVQTNPAAGETLSTYAGYAGIQLDFSSPVAAGQDLNRLVLLTPPIIDQSVSRSPDGRSIYLTGYFQSSTSYSLEVSPGLSDQWGAALGVPFSFTFSTSPASPSLYIPVRMASAAVFVSQWETSIAAHATNIGRLGLSRGELSLGEFIQADQSWEGLQGWESKVQSTWMRLLYPTPDVSEPVDIPLHQSDDPLPPGLYFLKIDTRPALDDGGLSSSPLLLVVSPIQMTMKTSLNQAFVWAVRIADDQPVAGAEVIIYDGMARPVASCTTDGQGICQADLPAALESNPASLTAYYAVIGQPGGINFSLAASGWNQGVAPWEFSLPYTRATAQPAVYLYTDRPIYRSGQAVNFRAVVRDQDNGRYALAPLPEITVDVVGPYDPLTLQSQVLTTLRLPLSPYGTATGVYRLPEDARTGSYTLRVQEVEFEETAFQVAEYRKPEIDLQVSFARAERLFGEDLQAQVSARYFFGSPAGNLPVQWTLFGEPTHLDLPGGLQTGRIDTGWLEPWASIMGTRFHITDGQAQTRPDGTLDIEISGDLLRERLEAQAGRLIRLTLEATITDESGLPVSARQSLRLHPSLTYIGVRPEQWSVSAGQELTYSITSVDWQGNPVPAQALTARFSKVAWVQQESVDPAAPPDYRMESLEFGSTEFVTSENGEARLAFTPGEPGMFMLEIEGADGAVTEVLTWVGGPGSVAWPGLPNQRLLLRSDRAAYQPGDQARIFIPNPFAEGAQALVTVERGKVMRSQVIAIQGASYELVLPLSDEDAPNIYVSVTLLGRTKGRPDFRVGYVELEVAPVAQLLQVELSASPRQAQPGGEVTVILRIRDASGNPLQGEFSLALVDKAVLALADPNSPSIVEAFYGRQFLGVQSSYSLAAYGGRSIYTPPGRGGGGGADALGQAVLRENFADTAFWSGTIETDPGGLAQLTLTLPDNLTTWQAEVRGLTAETLVGQAQVDLTTSKPLLIRPVTPRFVVPGDYLELAAVVHNNTGDLLQASVRLEGSGFTLDDLNTAVQQVDLPAGGHSRVSWWGTVQDVAALDLTFSAEAGSLQDITRPENGLLPVLRYQVPQTFGTAGVLAEAGVRLELVSLPRSFTPTGGELRLELSPSLSAVVLDGLTALEAFPRDFTEPVLSRLLPNLAAYRMLRDFQLEDEALRGQLEKAIAGSVDRLVLLQNEDGGWGWTVGAASDSYVSSYVLFGLDQAVQAGLFVDPQVVRDGQVYLSAALWEPSVSTEAWQIDRLAFQHFALQQSGWRGDDPAALFGFRDRLSPWGQAFLALALEIRSAGDEQARTLLSDLQTSVLRTDSGASWQDPNPAWRSWSTPNFTTAVAAYAIARLDPAAPLLTDAVRFLVLHRRPSGAWASSYESAWALLALVETIRGTGDLQAAYSYTGDLNGSPLVAGQVENPAGALNPVSANVPLAALRAAQPNALQIERGEGAGRLYYRAYLQVNRPAQDAPAVERGLSLTRQYYRAGQDCRREVCRPIREVDLADPQPLLVRLTLSVPEDMYYVVVEDVFPAGAEALNPRLKTAQQNLALEEPLPEGEQQPVAYALDNPFEQGWGWWLFQDPQMTSQRIRWVVDYLPAGAYELTYRLTPFLAGEFRLIPARAYQFYFPEVEATSAGGVLVIR